MQWLIVARDGTDEEAPARRMAARVKNTADAEEPPGSGQLLVGGALLAEEGGMIGSACVAQFETRAELEEWLRTDPYVTGKVWQHIEVIPYRVAPHYDFPPCPEAETNRSREER